MSAPWAVAFVALWGLVVLLALLVLGTLRRIIPVLATIESRTATARTPPRASGLDVGARVPGFVAETTQGDVLTDRDLMAATTVVLFIEASCRACDTLIATFDEACPAAASRLVVVGDQVDARAFASDPAVMVVGAPSAIAMASAFGNERTPEAFVVVEGIVGSKGITGSWDQLRELVSVAGRPHAGSGKGL